MILWFAGMSLVAMWIVFRDPAIDHRLVIVGALLPDVVDAAFGEAAVAHTLAAPVGLLFVVMGVTVGRRQVRRQLLAIPIGWFFHLVLDPVWSQTDLFWWPVRGTDFGGLALPAFDRPLALTIFLEIAGLVAIVWAFRRFGLDDPRRRANFVRTGRVDRALTDPEAMPPTC
jgi:hypothetical protein